MSTRPEITSPTEFLGTTVEELESRLATNALYDEDNKRLLEELLTENEELRKGNMTLEMENRRLQHALELDARRYRESVGAGDSDSRWDMYDWIANIDLLSDVSKEGWRIEFSEAFLRGLDDATQEHLLSGRPWSTPDGKGKPPPMGWQGAVVAVLGLYDKGKTFVLNHLTESKLPSGKKVSTKGLSFKHVMIDGGTRFILLDSEGSYSPVRVVDELSVVEKETTELFLQELIFEMSDYFLCVVNDFTSLDQRYLDKLTRNLQNSTKAFREVIVVHNCKEVIDDATLRHVWETQVTAIYGSGTMQHTKVAAIDAMTETLVEKTVAWFKTPFSRHVLLANHDSELGELLNPWAFSLLRYWLKSVFVPVNREFAVVDTVVHYSNIKLANHFKSHPQLQLVQTDQPHLAYIRSCSEVREQLRLQQISVDASGIMLARPDNYLPPVDIIKEVDGTYCIYMDVPGMTRAQIKLSRQNVVTIIKGTREPDFTERELATAVTRQERKHGDFTMTFRIPEEYGPAGRAHVPAHHPRSLSQNRAPRYPLQVSTPLVERHRRERRALRLVPQGRRRGPLGRGGHLRIARSLVSQRKKAHNSRRVHHPGVATSTGGASTSTSTSARGGVAARGAHTLCSHALTSSSVADGVGTAGGSTSAQSSTWPSHSSTAAGGRHGARGGKNSHASDGWRSIWAIGSRTACGASAACAPRTSAAGGAPKCARRKWALAASIAVACRHSASRRASG